MDARKFLEALGEIDEAYLKPAAGFAPAEKERRFRPAIFWAAAACLVLTVAGWSLFYGLGLGSPAIQETQELAAVQEASSAVPLSQLPTLSFPSREETKKTWTDCFWEATSASYQDRDLTDEEISSIWGQTALSWEGLDPKLEYDLAGVAHYRETGEFSHVTITGTYRNGGETSSSFSMDIKEGQLPVEMSGNNALTKTSDIWDTKVVSSAWYGGEGFANFTVEFLREPEHPLTEKDGENTAVGLRVHAVNFSGGPGEEAMKELLTRLTSQCLRPGNTFQLSHLDGEIPIVPVALEELPQLSFPSREETEKASISHSFSTEQEEPRQLSQTEIASIWGKEALFWEGMDIAKLCGPMQGTLAYDKSGNVSQVHLSCSVEWEGASLPLLTIDLCPGPISQMSCADQGQGFLPGTVWDTEVSTYAFYGASSSPSEEAVNYGLQFTKNGDEPISLQATCGNSNSDYFRRLGVTAEQCREILTRLASQCLRPGNTFQLSQFSIAQGRDEAQAENLEQAAKQVAQDYVNSWLENTEYPLSECYYDRLEYTDGVPFDGENQLQVSLRMIFKLENPQEPQAQAYWMAGNTAQGAGELEGYYTAMRFIYAKKEGDGWVITSSGTGP